MAQQQQQSNELFVRYSVSPKMLPLLQQQTHPATVVEAATLACIDLPIREWGLCSFKLWLPFLLNVYLGCDLSRKWTGLSTLQIETVVHAITRHQEHLPSGERAGYLVGDGTGVGKGRQLAGFHSFLIFTSVVVVINLFPPAITAYNYEQGRKKALWFSASNSLMEAATQDIMDVGQSDCKIPIFQVPKDASIDVNETNGVLFITYSMLVASKKRTSRNPRTRFEQIVDWIRGPDPSIKFDGVIVFDECHAAKNLDPGSKSSTKTGEAVLKLQEMFPEARIVYASATGASEPKHLAYMTRLGLWNNDTYFRRFSQFTECMDHGGIAAAELVAAELKRQGAYCSRHLSFEGAKFDVHDVKLTSDQIQLYSRCTQFWLHLVEHFEKAIIDQNQKKQNKMKAIVWAAHQQFFLQLILCLKVEYCSHLAKEALQDGKAVVIGMFSTGEAAMGHALAASELREWDMESMRVGDGPFSTLRYASRLYVEIPDLNILQEYGYLPIGEMVSLCS